MRLWSIHPRYLDPPGLGGLWREALLAQGVVSGRTAAYRNHPQARRVLEQADPWGSDPRLPGRGMGGGTSQEDTATTGRASCRIPASHVMAVPRGQLEYEAALLRLKLEARGPAYLDRLPPPGEVVPHPSIRVVDGGLARWERPRKDVMERLSAGPI